LYGQHRHGHAARYALQVTDFHKQINVIAVVYLMIFNMTWTSHLPRHAPSGCHRVGHDNFLLTETTGNAMLKMLFAEPGSSCLEWLAE